MLLPGLIGFFGCYYLCSNLRYARRVVIAVLRYIVHEHCFLIIYEYNIEEIPKVLPINGISSNIRDVDIVYIVFCR